MAFLDERLFETPSIAVSECNKLSVEMARIARDAVEKTVDHLFNYTESVAKSITELESHVDIYEDQLGSYLVRLSGGTCLTAIIKALR